VILAGDVGGTKVHLALYSFESGRLKPVRDQRFAAHEFPSLEAIIERFLRAEGAVAPAVPAERSAILAACFGAPGPVRDGRLKLTNLPWLLDARELSRTLGLDHIFLINDLEANGYGIPELAPSAIHTLLPGDPSGIGHRALISAGTGLGEALLLREGHAYRPIPSEGGHCDFGPRNDREVRLLQYLRAKLNGGHVSWERVVSGIGIQNIYAFLRDAERLEESATLRERLAAEDPNAVIAGCAADGSSPLCAETMRLFRSAYGAEAGNLALKVLPTGGLYLGGGIAPRILDSLADGEFRAAFLDKGRLTSMLETVPVRVILDDTCALLGAAAYAEARAAELSGHSERVASLNP
jgi:glucokinase